MGYQVSDRYVTVTYVFTENKIFTYLYIALLEFYWLWYIYVLTDVRHVLRFELLNESTLESTLEKQVIYDIFGISTDLKNIYIYCILCNTILSVYT